MPENRLKTGKSLIEIALFGGELQNDGKFFTFRKEKIAELLRKIVARMENICRTHDLQN